MLFLTLGNSACGPHQLSENAGCETNPRSLFVSTNISKMVTFTVDAGRHPTKRCLRPESARQEESLKYALALYQVAVLY